MTYNYAIIDDAGKCYDVRHTSCHTCDKYHVPIDEFNLRYLHQYYYPLPCMIDTDADFTSIWYSDASHTQIMEVI